MIIFVTILHVIVCLMLILVILLQAGKGQGLTGSAFGGGNVQSVLGTGAADFLAKATAVAAIGFLVTSLTLDWFEAKKSKSLLDATRQGAPIDMEAVQKALEKIKEEGAEAGLDGAIASETVSDVVEAVNEEAKTIEGDIKE